MIFANILTQNQHSADVKDLPSPQQGFEPISSQAGTAASKLHLTFVTSALQKLMSYLLMVAPVSMCWNSSCWLTGQLTGWLLHSCTGVKRGALRINLRAW